MNYVILESMFVLKEPAEMTATLEELYEQSATLEAFADDLESDLLVAAFEAVDSDDSSADEASAISTKFRSGYRKIEEGKKKNNKSMVTAGQREVAEASRELQAAEKNAKTAEQKQRLKKVAKIAIAVAGAVALAVLAYVGIKNRDKLAGAIRKLKRNNGESVASAVSDVKQITNVVASAPTESAPQAPTHQEIIARQERAESIRTERAHKKDMKDWSVFHQRHPSISREEYDKIRDNKRDRTAIQMARRNASYFHDKDTHGYTPDTYIRTDTEIPILTKYNRVLNDIQHKNYSSMDRSEGNEKRHKLLFRMLKSDIEKFKGLDKDKIDQMSNQELTIQKHTLHKLWDIFDDWKDSNKFGAREELKGITEDDISRIYNLLTTAIKQR